MVHIPSEHYYNELLANKELVRIYLAKSASGVEPTLCVKSNSLALKYIIKRKSFRLILARLGIPSRLLYAIEIPDDESNPGMIWSFAESDAELEAAKRIAQRETCHIVLFNEAAVNVCGARVGLGFQTDAANALLTGLAPSIEVASQNWTDAAVNLLDRRYQGLTKKDELIEAAPVTDYEWREIASLYETNRLALSTLSIISGNEGDQQEHLGLWLVDSLSPAGAVKSPQVEENTNTRELSDILLNYSGGCFLIESKTLSILDRGRLPDRSKLKKNVEKSARKAISQLGGGCRNVKRGSKVLDLNDKEVQITRNQPIHCIVLIPDLQLLNDSAELNPEKLRQFARDSDGCFLHVLDPGELLATIQNALLLSKSGQRTTPMMAFDFVLIERYQRATAAQTLNLRFRVRLPDAGN